MTMMTMMIRETVRPTSYNTCLLLRASHQGLFSVRCLLFYHQKEIVGVVTFGGGLCPRSAIGNSAYASVIPFNDTFQTSKVLHRMTLYLGC